MRTHRCTALAAVLGLLASAPALGQELPPTCGYSPVAGESAPPAFEAILARGSESRGADASAALLRRWFTGCDERAARQAALDLRNAVERRRSDPVLRALLGIALVRGPEVQIPGAQGYALRPTYQFSNSERDGRRLLAAVARETRWPEVVDELVAVALATRHRETLKEAHAVLRALTDASAPAGFWAARADVALALHEFGEARMAAGRAVELGDAAAVRALGIAMLRQPREVVQGAPVYLQGLEQPDAALLARYFEDLRPLLNEDDVAEWQATAPTDRGDWIRREWEWRASNAARSVAERLALHFERLEHAFTSYLRTAYRGARPDQALRIDPQLVVLPFDDRGLIYIRHGGPVEIIRAPFGKHGIIREAWAYRGLESGRAVFEFRKGKAYGDFVLAEPLTCDPFLYMFGEEGPRGEAAFERFNSSEQSAAAKAESLRRGGRAAPIASPPADTWIQDFQRVYVDYATSLGRFDPAYAAQGIRCYQLGLRWEKGLRNRNRGVPGRASGELLEDVRLQRLASLQQAAIAQRAAETALRTENAAPPFREPVRALLSTYALRGATGTELVAWLALPGGDIDGVRGESGVAYAVRMGLAVEHRDTRVVERRDTTLRFDSATPLTDGALVRTALSVPAATPTPNATIRLMLRNTADSLQGQVLTLERGIPSLTGGFTSSDLVVAEAREGSWRRGSARLAPIPGHQVHSGATFRLFHELYGADSEDPLRIRITIAPAAERSLLERLADLVSRRHALTLRFDELATLDSDGVMRVARDIGAELEPGSYSLEITVENGRTGEVAARRTDLLVVGARPPAPGT